MWYMHSPWYRSCSSQRHLRHTWQLFEVLKISGWRMRVSRAMVSVACSVDLAVVFFMNMTAPTIAIMKISVIGYSIITLIVMHVIRMVRGQSLIPMFDNALHWILSIDVRYPYAYLYGAGLHVSPRALTAEQQLAGQPGIAAKAVLRPSD